MMYPHNYTHGHGPRGSQLWMQQILKHFFTTSLPLSMTACKLALFCCRSFSTNSSVIIQFTSNSGNHSWQATPGSSRSLTEGLKRQPCPPRGPISFPIRWSGAWMLLPGAFHCSLDHKRVGGSEKINRPLNAYIIMLLCPLEVGIHIYLVYARLSWPAWG